MATMVTLLKGIQKSGTVAGAAARHAGPLQWAGHAWGVAKLRWRRSWQQVSGVQVRPLPHLAVGAGEAGKVHQSWHHSGVSRSGDLFGRHLHVGLCRPACGPNSTGPWGEGEVERVLAGALGGATGITTASGHWAKVQSGG